VNLDNVKKLKVLKQRITKVNDLAASLKESRIKLEQLIIEDLNADGASASTTIHGTVKLVTTEVPSVKDWIAFENYIYENNALYLLQRRAASPAYREEVKLRGEIPGVETFTTTSLSLSNKVT